jgi:hypothetical protein
MKIQGEKYRIMAESLAAVIKSRGGPEKIRSLFPGEIPFAGYWALWNLAENQIKIPDSHLAFQRGIWKRIYPYQPGFDVYSEGVNDSHIQTAITKICKEQGL